MTDERVPGRSIQTPQHFVPNVAQRTTQASRRGQVFTILLLALLINALSRWKKAEAKSNTGKFFQSLLLVNLPAWAVIWIALTALSDFDESADLAVAFSMLILLGSGIMNGEKALTAITDIQRDWGKKETP